MSNRPNRYKEMERNITIALIVDLVLFITFLIASGNSTTWLKVITFIMILVLSVLCLASVSPSHWVVFCVCACVILYKYFYKIYFMICTLSAFLKKCTWSRCHKYILFILEFLSFDFQIKPFTSDLIIYLYNRQYFFRTIS